MINTWIYRTLTEQQIEIQKKLADELSINPLLSQLLVQRDILTFEDARSFFRPDLGNLHDPFLMADMDKAVNRLTKAMQNNEKILIYGDYDVDGTTSVALVYKFLNQFYTNVDFYIPDRYTRVTAFRFKELILRLVTISNWLLHWIVELKPLKK